MNALLGSELIEILSLEKLVNQSRSLCHIVSTALKFNNGNSIAVMNSHLCFHSQEPCSALMDLRRWSDRKTLRGLRWLLRAICLDYPELCTRIGQDSKRPLETKERERNGKTEKIRKKTKVER